MEKLAFAVNASPEEPIVEDFISKFKFFPPHIKTAAKILHLNEQLSDSYIHKELGALPPPDLNPPENRERAALIDGSWLSTVMERVSAILFHEDEREPEQVALTDDEVVSLFQKNLSERIYNRLSMLSRSPHARKGRPFSIKEELTEGIAVNVGLGLYRYPETPEPLRAEAQGALLDLAWEFQQWLLFQPAKTYQAQWGQVRAVDAKTTASVEKISPVVVLMMVDVQNRTEESGQPRQVTVRQDANISSPVSTQLASYATEKG